MVKEGAVKEGISELFSGKGYPTDLYGQDRIESTIEHNIRACEITDHVAKLFKDGYTEVACGEARFGGKYQTIGHLVDEVVSFKKMLEKAKGNNQEVRDRIEANRLNLVLVFLRDYGYKAVSVYGLKTLLEENQKGFSFQFFADERSFEEKTQLKEYLNNGGIYTLSKKVNLKDVCKHLGVIVVNGEFFKRYF